MFKKKVNRVTKLLFIYILISLILLLTSININMFLQNSKRVLGVAIQDNQEAFWQDFLAKNPNYIPGWIEIGRTDKANEIDRNYTIP